MLMRFSAANYRSICHRQELSLVASSLSDEGAELIEVAGLKEKLVPTIVIYGANASGKTNALRSIKFFREAIVESHKSRAPTQELPIKVFALDEESAQRPSEFDCDFILSGTRYNYGFQLTKKEILEEWLYFFPKGSRQTLFTRSPGKKFRFGKNLRGRNAVIADLTRPNSLFLSAAAQNDHDLLSQIYRYFDQQWQGIVGPAVDLNKLSHYIASKGVDQRLISFLQHADVGIDSIRVDQEAVPAEIAKLFQRFQDVVTEEFPDDGERPVALDLTPSRQAIKFGHRTASGESYYMPLAAESRGTARLLRLIHSALGALDSGGVLLLDEIDSSLHTLLAIRLLELFSSRATNSKGAQLITTTHDTNLLCSGHLRRDQVWFCEKDPKGATHYYPLTDIKTRKSDNLEKGYLQGRFGGVPFLGTLEKMISGSAGNDSP